MRQRFRRENNERGSAERYKEYPNIGTNVVAVMKPVEARKQHEKILRQGERQWSIEFEG